MLNRGLLLPIFIGLLSLTPGPARGSEAAAAPAHKAASATATRVSRDFYGVPHIFAPDANTLFETYGWVVAQDRLWQLELNRRAARGQLAEILGPNYVQADRFVRLTGYTEEELQAQYAGLPAEQRAHVHAYAAGINRYIRELTPDPNRLPYEFRSLGLVPGTWTTSDVVAFGVFMLRRFGEIGGREQTNESLLAGLIQRHGPETGVDIFNDVLWVNDPGALTTIAPPTQADAAPAASAPAVRRAIPAAQWPATVQAQFFPSTEQAMRQWDAAGVPSRLGSYAWVVSPKRSAEGIAMLYGGPQMGTSTPEVVHEVQLHSDDGWNVAGMAFAGVPYVLIGHNTRVAWTSTTAVGDNVDTYRETLCHREHGGFGTRYRGRCEPVTVRQEVIKVQGEAPVHLEVWRTIHGPAVPDVHKGVAIAQKRAHWQHEIAGLVGFARFGRADDIAGFESGIETIVTQHNFLYADTAGNIAYWQAGLTPVRPKGFDFRLPLPGDGTAEWPGETQPVPKIKNPPQGFLANWNNKPEAGFDSADSHFFGKQSRLSDIVDRLQFGKISWQDMLDIPLDIGRVDMTGRQTRYLKAYLLHALRKYPSTQPLVQAAAQRIQNYDGTVVSNVISSTQRLAEHEIFSQWVERMMERVFAPVLREHTYLARVDLLVRALDIAARGHSTLAMQHIFIAADTAYSDVAEAFAEAVDGLRKRRGDDIAQWAEARQSIRLAHPLLGTVDTLWSSNRATFAQVVRLHPEGAHSESIHTLGQSGLIMRGKDGAPVFDAHFKDQLPKYRAFEYKPVEFLFASP